MQNENRKWNFIEARWAIVGNVFLFIAKYYAGFVTGSVALMADAWHTLSDSASSVIVLIGARVSDKPADKEHPFGHGRAELIATIAIGVLLVLVSYSFLEKAINKLQDHEHTIFGPIAIGAMILSVIVKEGMAQFALWANKKVRSNMLKADAWHHRTDAISSVVILIGVILGRYFWWIDGVLGIVVSLLIFYAAIEIFRDSIRQILGQPVDEKTKNNLRNICKQHEVDLESVHHFHMHEYGDHTELTFHLRLPKSMTISLAHQIVEKIEQDIRDKLAMEATIHVEPADQMPEDVKNQH